MATNINDAGEGHNSGNRDPKYIADQVRLLDKELEPLEKQAKDIREDMKTVRNHFKAETGITIADFNAARRLAKMEDEGERDAKKSNLSICFNALANGGQLNWIDAVEQDNTTEQKKAA